MKESPPKIGGTAPFIKVLSGPAVFKKKRGLSSPGTLQGSWQTITHNLYAPALITWFITS